MCQGASFAADAGGNGAGHERRYGSADIGPDDHGQGVIQAHETMLRKDDKNTDRNGRGMDKTCKDNAHPQAPERIFRFLKETYDGRIVTQGRSCLRGKMQTKEEEAEVKNGLPQESPFLFSGKPKS